MKIDKLILGFVIALILLTPLPFYVSGLGQNALSFANELGKGGDGLPLSSPRAELWHQLVLPLRLWRLLLYPLLLWFFLRSGSALRLRDGSADFLNRLAGRLPPSWKSRLDSPIGAALLFILAFETGLFLVYLPLSFYSGFILRQQFGLSTQAFLSWAQDLFLNFIIGAIMDALSYGILYGLIVRFPRRWPYFAGLLLTISSAVMMIVYPLFITPLFYHVQPLADSSLRFRSVASVPRQRRDCPEPYG